MRNRFFLALTVVLLLTAAVSLPAADDGTLLNAISQDATSQDTTLPIDQIQPGMKGVAYTIFSGDTVEPMDLTVIGVLHNALGPKVDVILVQLLGDKPEHSGVVAGMSGSPVFINGKLAGALSLKLGMFTKEAIGGVTPIANMYDINNALPADGTAKSPATSYSPNIAPNPARNPASSPDATQWATMSAGFSAPRIPVSTELAQRASLDAGSFLVPIETPLIMTGVYPETIAQFASQFSALGMTAMVGGKAAPSPEDAKLKPGDMVGMELVGGDLSLDAGCTVTAIVGDRVFACGHPLFSFGDVSIPLTRGHVVMTLNSSMASTKIMSSGSVIGTLTEDRTTAVMGRLGAGPRMIPMDVAIVTPQEEKRFHFEVAELRQLTPLLVAVSALNGISGNTAYTEGTTLQLSGAIDVRGHGSVKLEDFFAPQDSGAPSGLQIAFAVLRTFSEIYTNPYEPPKIDKISLRVTSLPEHRSATIESAWSEKSEVEPGETIGVKVLLRPYRGSPFIQEIPITIPLQSARGPMELLVSDGETLNRMTQPFGAPSQLAGLDELVAMMNRERHNDRLYAALMQPTPTLLVEDKELPNVPLSEINIMDQRRNPGAARLLNQSAAGEWSVPMNQVIAGQRALTITVK
ncbi:MAG: hypothetical protein WA734_03200 [Candidatus Acidiferrales bacterium]